MKCRVNLFSIPVVMLAGFIIAAQANAWPPFRDFEVAKPAEPIQPFDHITVDLASRTVMIDAIVCLDVGWLEQVLCGAGSREHESLVVTEAKPQHIHAALLMVDFTSGKPGEWHYSDDGVTVTQPSGDEIIVEVQYIKEDGSITTHSIRKWIRDHKHEKEFPKDNWVFAGSQLRQPTERMKERGMTSEIYVADFSGSIIGLVTFGDEVIGFPEVLPDEVAAAPPEWEVNTDTIPPLGTKVKVILRPTQLSDE